MPTTQKVAFKSEGTTVAGDLSLPDDYRPGMKRPGLVLGHGFGVVKQSLVREAEFFASAGYVVLTIDYRTFGESEGEPRGQLFPLRQVEDFRNGISYLQQRPEVDPDQIGIWGASFGGGIVIWTAAVDRRVKAVVSEVPVVNGHRWMQALYTSAGWDALLDRLEADRKRRYETGASERVPPSQRGGPTGIVPMDERTAAFHVDHLKQTGKMLLVSEPEITLESIEKVIEFNPESVIHLIGPRLLYIVTTGGWDVIHLLDQIQDAYKKANEPRKLVLLPCEAYEVYRDPHQAMALEAALECYHCAIPIQR